ncbi:ribokinase [Velocimicrobium porci]|uniref:Ribokinase n=1 Tax=Velocimicrobium porci TaxID=2606634 RepID=A0A6L5XU23_9FIRM|nr:ribokinase [Velocimicrobium porci]MSS62300.1 ribokinase [Velocimicrobium porci]
MKLAVVGSINMDMTVTAERIPKKGETLKGDSVHYIPGGKGANQAVAMARLGAEVGMFGCVGDDQFGKDLVENLQKEHIFTKHIAKIEDCPTGTAFITVGENDNTIVVVAGANGKVDKAYVDSIKEELKQYDMVVLQNEIPMETVEYVVDLCSEANIPIILNPAPACKLSEQIIKKVTYLTPNEHEVKLIFGEMPLEKILKQYPEKLIVTQGSMGVSVCKKDGTVVTIPARKANVADTTGAGDTLNGAFAVQAAGKKEMEEALLYANVAASLSTEKFGAQGGMPTNQEVELELEKLRKDGAL